eukprot:symbB.v1.2.038936.t1/scaffold6249.1/size19653/2
MRSDTAKYVLFGQDGCILGHHGRIPDGHHDSGWLLRDTRGFQCAAPLLLGSDVLDQRLLRPGQTDRPTGEVPHAAFLCKTLTTVQHREWHCFVDSCDNIAGSSYGMVDLSRLDGRRRSRTTAWSRKWKPSIHTR